ncbi:MAG: hypothetical protein ACI35Q_07145 [Marinilabiliaceae bacterium]
MRLSFQFDHKDIYLLGSRLQEVFAYEAEDVLADLICCVCWPEEKSTEFWVEELSDIIYGLLSEVKQGKRAPIEYIFNDVGFYCNNPKLFYLTDVQYFRDLAEDVPIYGFYGARESIFASKLRKLTQEQDVYAVWIFYRLLDPYGRYTKAELKSIIAKWLDVIRRDPAEWESMSGVPQSDVRFFTEFKKYRWHLDL